MYRARSDEKRAAALIRKLRSGLERARELGLLRDTSALHLLGSSGVLPEDYPDGEPAVSIPDLGFAVGLALSKEQIAALENAITASVGTGAFTQRVLSNETRVGYWQRETQDSVIVEARQRGIDEFDILDGHGFAIWIANPLVQAQATQQFAALPKDLDTNGQPAAGPIHLKGLAVTLVPPDTVETVVAGTEDETWPSADLTITLRDRLSANDGPLACETTSVASVDETPLLAATILSAGLLNLHLLEIVQGAESIAYTLNSPPAGVGCRIANQFPLQFPLADGKLVLFYSVPPQVAAEGMILRGELRPLPRSPSVEIVGQTGFLIRRGSARSVSAVYRLAVTDLWSPVIEWSGDAKFNQPNQGVVVATFDVPEYTPTGSTLAKRLTVTVADGVFSATAELTIGITVLDHLPRVPSHRSLPLPRTKS